MDNYNETIWNSSPDIINVTFNNFINLKYLNFKFNYNWVNFPEIEDYIKRLMYNSYISNVNIRRELPLIIHDVEDFFASGFRTGLFNKNNINGILNDLKDKNDGFLSVEYLPDKYKGCYGASIGNKIFINDSFCFHPNSPNLNNNELRKLYMFHEMGHKIININSRTDVINNYKNTIDNILQSNGLFGKDTKFKDLIDSGFWMIEESLVQELAEYLTYSSVKKNRPCFSNKYDLGCLVSTNHDYYGIFQKPTVQLGRTLRGCACGVEDDNQVAINMIKRALNSNFDSELISEYYEAGIDAYYNLFLILRLMGIIRKNKYASLNLENPINASNYDCLVAINNLTKKYRDRRSYPINGFREIDFSLYGGNKCTKLLQKNKRV